MNKSESIASLAAALAKAQGEMHNPVFDSNNPFFKSKYASLAAVRNAVIPVFAKHGLAVSQLLRAGENASVETILMHASGEWISEILELPVAKRDPQGYISASTYARRASLQSIAGVVGDSDDDGNEASKPAKSAPAKPVENVSNAPTLEDCLDNIATAADMDELKSLYLDAIRLYPGSKKEIAAKKDARKEVLLSNETEVTE